MNLSILLEIWNYWLLSEWNISFLKNSKYLQKFWNKIIHCARKVRTAWVKAWYGKSWNTSISVSSPAFVPLLMFLLKHSLSSVFLTAVPYNDNFIQKIAYFLYVLFNIAKDVYRFTSFCITVLRTSLINIYSFLAS